MSIIRVHKENNYVSLSNVPLNDRSLSWEARGLHAYLLSKPDDWVVRFTNLVNESPAGDHKVRRILKELENAKYLERKKIRQSDGTYEWESSVFEHPYSDNRDMVAPTTSRLSTYGSSTSGKPRDIDTTDLDITEVKSAPNGATPQPKDEEPKPKSKYVINSEMLENVFAKARGVKQLTAKDWESEKSAKALMKTWRKPVNEILEWCEGDVQKAAKLISYTVNMMRQEKLTFSKPVQILENAQSYLADMNTPQPNTAKQIEVATGAKRVSAN